MSDRRREKSAKKKVKRWFRERKVFRDRMRNVCPSSGHILVMTKMPNVINQRNQSIAADLTSQRQMTSSNSGAMTWVESTHKHARLMIHVEHISLACTRASWYRSLESLIYRARNWNVYTLRSGVSNWCKLAKDASKQNIRVSRGCKRARDVCEQRM